MRSAPLILIAALIVAGFLVYMTTYTVRFTEAGVVTTFGKVSPNDVVTKPGLKFKWPYPIQTTTIYDTRARFLQTKSEQQPTADEKQIVVESFITWKVEDPLLFYQKFGGNAGGDTREHYRSAENILTSRLRSAMSEVAKYRLGELFTPEIGKSKLGQLESDIEKRLTVAEGDFDISKFGVKILLVGVNSVVLPEQTTNSVFEAMRETRNKLASVAEYEGTAEAERIKSEAENGANKIRSFASTVASRIENQGDLEAAQWLAALNEDPELAEYLKKVEFLRTGFGKRLTLVLPTSMWGLDLLAPDALQRIQRPAKVESEQPAPLPNPSPAAGNDPVVIPAADASQSRTAIDEQVPEVAAR